MSSKYIVIQVVCPCHNPSSNLTRSHPSSNFGQSRSSNNARRAQGPVGSYRLLGPGCGVGPGGHWARRGRHSTEAVENLQALLLLKVENYTSCSSVSHSHSPHRVLRPPSGSTGPMGGILGSTTRTARGDNGGWEVQKWALHQAEKVNVEKLPAGAYWAVGLGQGLHLQMLRLCLWVVRQCTGLSFSRERGLKLV